ncbi:solute carrier organic anion transporter family member 4C1-like isoform X1 [Acipenser ruthenus]|uniref:solute carrier organic anion transporter family member 4C1-like isoform X1 n=1 Tax=Acipenser ruthenus TaxID=7906 RepID=UPI00274250A2|nr:solute carrier organic anion transporter family member 4C1-like isoform X1 [Acipenser ruthenus]
MKEGVVNSAFVSNENLQLHRDDEQKPHEKAHEEEFSEGPCGWSNFTPSCLQCCNNAKGFVFIFGLLVIVQKNDTVPATNRSEDSCSTSSLSALSNYFYVFILGHLIMGVGGTSIYTLGIAHIDISVPSEKSSLYTGVGYMMTILGVALGYIVGGQLLNIYVDVDQLQDVALSPEDPRWVGGWWIGYLIGLPAAWLLIVPFLGFPKHLPGTAKIHAEKVSQVHHDGSEDIVKEKDVGKSFKDFPLSLKLLLKNPVFMCLTLTATSEGMTSFGTSIFFTKFIENQYGKTASISSLIAGCVIIPGAAIGQVLGGLVVSKFKMKCKQTIRLAIATSFASLMFSACYVLAKCDNPEFAGISVENGATGNLSAPCNANYNCDRSHYNPVCGVNNVQYFSPCHAGCKDHVLLSKTEVYYNCSCIEDTHNTSESKAYSGKCATMCNKLPILMVLMLIAGIITCMTSTPVITAVLWCVPEKQRSFALGVQWAFIRLLGAIPAPILLGSAIDHSCILWDNSTPGSKGACLMYDNLKLASTFSLFSAAFKLISGIFIVVAYFLYKPPPGKDESNDKSSSTTLPN